MISSAENQLTLLELFTTQRQGSLFHQLSNSAEVQGEKCPQPCISGPHYQIRDALQLPRSVPSVTRAGSSELDCLISPVWATGDKRERLGQTEPGCHPGKLPLLQPLLLRGSAFHQVALCPSPFRGTDPSTATSTAQTKARQKEMTRAHQIPPTSNQRTSRPDSTQVELRS